MAATPNLALFDIDADGQDRGFESAGDTSHTLRLRRQPPIGITSVVFQVFDPNAFVADDPIASNPPRASTDAPLLTLSGATSGQRVSPTTVGGSVSVNIVGGAAASWIVRCIVNGGVKTLPNGVQVTDPSLVHERGLYVAGDGELRKPVATEVGQFHVDGWAEVIASMVDKVLANVTGILTRGAGAVFATFLRRSQNEVWVTDFMSVTAQDDAFNCTETLDLQPVIQAAIDYALYTNRTRSEAGGPRVRLPGGVLRIDRTIQLGYGIDLRSIVLEGEGIRYGGNDGAEGSGTAIKQNFNNAPGISVQGIWFGQIRDLTIFGPNQTKIVGPSGPLNAPSMGDLNVTNWIDGSFPASASAQFSPQCAIAIDPYYGAQPPVHYPDVPYPPEFGALGQYNKGNSSNLVCRNLLLQGHVVGIALQPCNTDGNGDFMRFDNISFFYCAYGFVWGNSQARVTVLENCSFLGNHTGITNKTFGTQGGNAQLAVRGASFNSMIRIADLDTQNGGGPIFEHCFGESLYSLGIFGYSADNATGVEFIGGEYGFSWWTTYGVPINIFVNGARRALASFQQVRFFLNAGDGTVLGPTLSWGGIHMSSGGLIEPARVYGFQNCGVTYPAGEPTQLWQKCALNATAGLSISTLGTRVERYEWRLVHRYNLDTGADLGVWGYGHLNSGDRARCLPAYGLRASGSHFGADPGVDLTWRPSGINTTGAPTISGRNITVTYSGSWTADSAWRLGGDVGDVIEDATSGTLYWVYSRTGFVVSARAQTGFDSSGNLLSPPGTNQSFWGLNCRRYCPSIFGGDVAIYGDLTAGNATISNVVDGSGAAFNASSVIAVGDWLYQEPAIDKLFVSDAACKVAAIASGSITMSGNAARNATHLRLAVFTRPAMPNGTATP